ncbi:acyl-CoA dehydrogenase family protein [Nocardioides terrisoli]|uniref:acyl-CoA dehydrogenase family protein n=1 Tax=Nocardioides terrisoli TaxID=3388267 RepID=UPI00287BC771|nr:acyl-CoA dehydrogenase family protein [Nocardioides marmorisolisilvae]
MFEISDEQRALIHSVRQFVRQKILPVEEHLDPDETEVPHDVYERLTSVTRQMGLYNMDLPPELGGPEINLVTRCLLAIEMSQHRAGLYAPCYDAFGYPNYLPVMTAHATPYQQEKYIDRTVTGEIRGCFALSEPSGGSDPGRSIQTRAVQDGDDWIINGSKLWISHAHEADYALLFARTGGPGRDGVTCFIVDTETPGFSVRRIVHTLRSSHPATELSLDDLRVPGKNILGGLGKGFSLANERLSRNRIPYSAACIGIAIRAQELAVEYAKIREAFGKKLSEHQGLAWMLVESEHDIRSATWMVLHAAATADAGRPFRTEAALAKVAATEAASRVVDRAIQVHGGMGVSREMPLERWYRELRIRRIGEGATEVQKVIVSRDLFGSPYRSFLDKL